MLNACSSAYRIKSELTRVISIDKRIVLAVITKSMTHHALDTHHRDDKLLIIHADDFGMCHSVNRAIIAAFEQEAITSASVMVPCAWFTEAAEYGRRNNHDIGIHLTFTSEWMTYRWRPLSPHLKLTGLVDSLGYFWASANLITAEPEDIATEISCQVSAARRAGMTPSHIDNHMFSLISPRLIGTYVKSSRQSELPFLIDAYWHSYAVREEATPGDDLVVDMVVQAEDPNLPITSMEDFYLQAVQELRPGVNQLIVHPGCADAELQGITGDQRAFGAAWRQRDFDILTSDKFRRALRQNDIVLTNWRTIRQFIPAQAASREKSL